MAEENDIVDAQVKVDELGVAERLWNQHERRRSRFARIQDRHIRARVWTLFCVACGVFAINSIFIDARAVQDHVDFQHENSALCATADNREITDRVYNEALYEAVIRLGKRHKADADVYRAFAAAYTQRRDASKPLRVALCPVNVDIPKVIESPPPAKVDGAQLLFGGAIHWVKTHIHI